MPACAIWTYVWSADPHSPWCTFWLIPCCLAPNFLMPEHLRDLICLCNLEPWYEEYHQSAQHAAFRLFDTLHTVILQDWGNGAASHFFARTQKDCFNLQILWFLPILQANLLITAALLPIWRFYSSKRQDPSESFCSFKMMDSLQFLVRCIGCKPLSRCLCAFDTGITFIIVINNFFIIRINGKLAGKRLINCLIFA